MARGVNTLIDSVNIYVEHFDFLNSTGSVGSVLTVASATGTYNGADFNNTTHKGGKFFLNFVSVNATATVRINIQSKDPLSGLYINGVVVSYDAIAVNTTGLQAIHVYPSFVATLSTLAGGASPESQFNETLVRTMRVQASITVQATATAVAANFSIGLTKVV